MNTPTERTVTNNILTSTADPAIKIQVDRKFTYLGRLEFILYGVASVELFAFVADSDYEAWRFLNIQFEQYLDTNTHTYNYPPTNLVSLGAHTYVHDTFIGPTSDDLANPESDSAKLLNYIKDSGYTLPEEVITTRFVRLLDSTNRSEILISYNENLTNLGLTAAETSDDYRPKPQYAHLAALQSENARKSFTVLEG